MKGFHKIYHGFWGMQSIKGTPMIDTSWVFLDYRLSTEVATLGWWFIRSTGWHHESSIINIHFFCCSSRIIKDFQMFAARMSLSLMNLIIVFQSGLLFHPPNSWWWGALIAWKQRSLGNHLPHGYRPSRRSHRAGWCVWLPWKGNSAFVRRFWGDSPPNRYSTWILWIQLISIGRVPWFSGGNKWISNIQVGY